MAKAHRSISSIVAGVGRQEEPLMAGTFEGTIGSHANSSRAVTNGRARPGARGGSRGEVPTIDIEVVKGNGGYGTGTRRDGEHSCRANNNGAGGKNSPLARGVGRNGLLMLEGFLSLDLWLWFLDFVQKNCLTAF